MTTKIRINETSKKVGLIGCGRMGIGLCRNLLRNGFQVVALDISPENQKAASNLGAQIAENIESLVDECNLIMTCLPTIDAIKSVYEDKLLKLCATGALVIEMSSASPELRAEYVKTAETKGILLADAPMLRSAADAWEGTIQILLGGSDKAVKRARPVLEAVSEKIISAGKNIGDAHIMKSLNNAVAMTNHAILCEVYAVAEAIGLDRNALFEMMRGSMAASYKLEDYVPKLLNNHHPSNAKMAFAEKDLSICHSIADSTPILTPVLDSAYFTYRLACTMGGADEPPSRLGYVLRKTTS